MNVEFIAAKSFTLDRVGQKNVDLDDLVDVCAGSLKNIGQVFDALVLGSANNGQPDFYENSDTETMPSPTCTQC